MLPLQFGTNQIEFVLLSFEGPDFYSMAGGLGVRETNLGVALANRGYRTHLFFIGDPDLPSQEERNGGLFKLYRWSQWISQYHPWGVYDGEEGKLTDYTESVPPFITNQIARPVIESRRHLVVLAEDWHTAWPMVNLSDHLHQAGLRQRSVLIWNANNTMGFHRLDFQRLNYTSTVTTVSRYMKQIMRPYGLDPLIIPNGIPSDLLKPIDLEVVKKIRGTLCQNGEFLLIKVARFDPAKCWWGAMEAAAQLKQKGERVTFISRGGIEPHGGEVLQHAYELGLTIQDVAGQPANWQEALELIRSAGPADIYNVQFFMPQPILRNFYAAADAILANSKHEPFGLVGLEAMAAGGIAFTGPTGETYSADGQGAIALDTESADEIILHIMHLRDNPERALSIRQMARKVASKYTWDKVLEVLFEKVQLAACQQQTMPFSEQVMPKKNGTNKGDKRGEGQSQPIQSPGHRLKSGDSLAIPQVSMSSRKRFVNREFRSHS